ncbi:MAG TPA: DUF4382 domain-containing protein [Caldimonas sp.]|jgi:hypothetical protein
MPLVARFLKIAALAAATLLGACGGGGGSAGGTGGPPLTDAGFLRLALTDAPACGYSQIDVTVLKVRVHPSSTAADGDAGWSEVVLSSPQRIDLLALTNGVVLELGQVMLPVGNYRQMSLVLVNNDATTPLANAVTPVGLAEAPLAIPASLQGGLKIPIDIDVVKNQITDEVIDFDACNSVLRLGAPGSYQLSPKYSIIRRVSTTGQRVTGYVATSLDPSTTRISLQSGGTIVRSTAPDPTGRFVLYPVPAGTGTYDLVVSALGRVPALITGVPEIDTASTDINTNAVPIDPPPSVTRTVTGTVSTGTTPIDARVAIVKPYAGGPNVVVAGAPANGTTGALAYTVSSQAPVRAAFSAGTPPAFSADNSAPTGRYTVAVTAGGTTKTADVDATGGDPAPVTFTFP